jgi:Skp family chaperone for outer membrane proteins
MFYRLMMASALSLVATSSAFAQASAPAAAPANPEECLKSAFEIAQRAEEQKLPSDQLDKIEELLSKMENHCDSRQFSEAAAVAQDLQSLVDVKKQ